MLNALSVYQWLMGTGARPQCEAFDAHVVASVLSLAVVGTESGVSVVEGLGLAPDELLELVEGMFPHARALFAGLAVRAGAEISADESCLRDLLWRGASERTPFEQKLARIVARRALSPNHLWQDLGLRHRRELSWLMSRHFEPLANKNVHDMKWKKFLYRVICRDASFSLCAAPSCSECNDFDECFGDESGESLLAVSRRESERADSGRAALGEEAASAPGE